MNRIQIVERNKASLILRFVNNLMDFLVLIILNFILTAICGLLYEITNFNFFYFYNNGGFLWEVFSGNVIFFLYYYLLEKFLNGRTIGKYVTGTKAVTILGGKPSNSDLLKRTFSRLVPFDALSFFGTNGWHDSWSDTRVVKIRDFENAMRMENELENIGKE